MKVIDSPLGLLKISSSECVYVMDELREKKGFRPSVDTINNDVGVYIFWGWDDTPIRIGKAVKTRNRILQYFRTGKEIIDSCQYVSYIRCKNEAEAANLEIVLISHYQPIYNIHYNTKKKSHE